MPGIFAISMPDARSVQNIATIIAYAVIVKWSYFCVTCLTTTLISDHDIIDIRDKIMPVKAPQLDVPPIII